MRDRAEVARRRHNDHDRDQDRDRTTIGTNGTTTAAVAAVDATSDLPLGRSTFSGAGLAPQSTVMMRGAETAEKTAETTVAAMVAAAMMPLTHAPSTASWSIASRNVLSSQPLVPSLPC